MRRLTAEPAGNSPGFSRVTQIAGLRASRRRLRDLERPPAVMMVETELRTSPIHGIGVFLLKPVRAGQLIWRFDSRIDRVYTPDEVTSLPAHMRDYLETYCTWHEGAGVYVLCGDNGRYFNHSETPTTVSNGISFGEDHAARDLAAGEELTSDYRTICDYVRKNGNGF